MYNPKKEEIMNMKEYTDKQLKLEKFISKISFRTALLLVVIQNFLLWFFLWLGAFDFTTRRPALGLMAMFLMLFDVVVFTLVFIWIKNELQNPKTATLRAALDNWEKNQADEYIS
jgi:hypothetical protein